VHKAAEAVATLDIAAYRYELWRLRRLERESAVGAFAVVVLDVDAQDVFEVAAADDQEPVETFCSDGADEPLRYAFACGARTGVWISLIP